MQIVVIEDPPDTAYRPVHFRSREI